MNEEFQIKIDPGPPRKKDAGWLGTGISSAAVATVICLILGRGFFAYLKTEPQRERIREQQLFLKEQQQQAIKAINHEIQNTPPEKMSRSMKILLGIDDGKEPSNTANLNLDEAGKLEEGAPER